jgi:hypothetical protein
LSDDVREETSSSAAGAGGGGGGGAAGMVVRKCTMSQVATLLVTLVKEYPVYSHVFYLASLLHVVVIIFSLLYRFCCGHRANNFTDNDFSARRTLLDEVEDDEIEEDGGESDLELASKQWLMSDEGDTERRGGNSGRSSSSGSSGGGGRGRSIARSLGSTYGEW